MGADRFEAVTIDGLTVRIYTERMADWKTFNIIRRIQSAGRYEQLDALFEVIEHVTDQTEASIVEHCGGDDAKAEDVVSLAVEIVKAATPKN